jgi:hypothetical protein
MKDDRVQFVSAVDAKPMDPTLLKLMSFKHYEALKAAVK